MRAVVTVGILGGVVGICILFVFFILSCKVKDLFYIYREDRKKQLISYASLCLAQMVTAVFIVSAGNIEWYEAVWQIGSFLPIPLICLYNGESGRKNIVNKWSFYLFYPIHFLVLWLILKA